MKPRLYYYYILVLFLMNSPRGARASGPDEPESTAPETQSFEAFQLVVERNIFDPNRRKPSERQERREPPPAPPRKEYISVTGAMTYHDQWVAFFQGTDSDYSGARRQGEEIAGLRITKIGLDNVWLEKEGTLLELAVGTQMARVGEGEWTVSEESVSLPEPSASRNPDSPGETSQPEESGDAGESDADDILKRMMERRKQQLSK